MTTEFKEGDKVDFDHLGEAKTGTVLTPASDGKVRIKDSRGYQFRYSPENVRMAGEPRPAPAQPATDASATVHATAQPADPATPAPQPQESETTNTNQSTPDDTMAKKAKEAATKAAKEPKAPKAAPATGTIDTKAIQALTCKKHQRIFLLQQLGCEKIEIMKLAGCNPGEISNVKKMYAAKPERATEAKALLG